MGLRRPWWDGREGISGAKCNDPATRASRPLIIARGTHRTPPRLCVYRTPPRNADPLQNHTPHGELKSTTPGSIQIHIDFIQQVPVLRNSRNRPPQLLRTVIHDATPGRQNQHHNFSVQEAIKTLVQPRVRHISVSADRDYTYRRRRQPEFSQRARHILLRERLPAGRRYGSAQAHVHSHGKEPLRSPGTIAYLGNVRENLTVSTSTARVCPATNSATARRAVGVNASAAGLHQHKQDSGRTGIARQCCCVWCSSTGHTNL